jgi:hypothetical protein
VPNRARCAKAASRRVERCGGGQVKEGGTVLSIAEDSMPMSHLCATTRSRLNCHAAYLTCKVFNTEV